MEWILLASVFGIAIWKVWQIQHNHVRKAHKAILSILTNSPGVLSQPCAHLADCFRILQCALVFMGNVFGTEWSNDPYDISRRGKDLIIGDDNGWITLRRSAAGVNIHEICRRSHDPDVPAEQEILRAVMQLIAESAGFHLPQKQMA